MLTITECAAADYADVAALWNAQTSNAGSCWYQATTIEASFVPALLATSYAIAVAREDGVAVGFGMWSPLEDLATIDRAGRGGRGGLLLLDGRLLRLGPGARASSGRAQVDNRATIERARMDALGSIIYTAIGYEPLPPGGEPQTRVPTLFEASSDLQALSRRDRRAIGESLISGKPLDLAK